MCYAKCTWLSCCECHRAPVCVPDLRGKSEVRIHTVAARSSALALRLAATSLLALKA